MRRRALLFAVAAGACSVVLPTVDSRPAPSDKAIEWLQTVRGLTYEQRRLYVAALRREPYYGSSDQFAELVDMIDGMNERGSFA